MTLHESGLRKSSHTAHVAIAPHGRNLGQADSDYGRPGPMGPRKPVVAHGLQGFVRDQVRQKSGRF